MNDLNKEIHCQVNFHKRNKTEVRFGSCNLSSAETKHNQIIVKSDEAGRLS